MAKPLKKQELQAALAKLREQYAIQGERYDRQVFNLDRFNERYLESIRIGMPAEHFLAGEVRTFQELMQKAEEKYAPRDTTVADRVDRLLEDFAARIRVYPAHPLCPRADEETRHLAGMLLDFQERYGALLPSPRRLPPGTERSRLAVLVEERAYALLLSRGEGLPPRMADLVLELSRITSGEREQASAKKEFFKESGFLLNLVADLFRRMLDAADPDTDLPLMEEALDRVEAALDAFRIREFRLGRL